MIPRLFPADYTHGRTTFVGDGLGELVDATKVEAEENSSEGHEWELSFEYPDTGELFTELKLNRIVVAKVNDYQQPQAFRIYSISKSLNHNVTVACQHISYDLQNTPVKPFSEIGAVDCIRALLANMVDTPNSQSQATYGKQFSFVTNLPDPEHKSNPRSEAERQEITLEFEEPQNARSLVFDSENSIIGKYGGDAVIDNYYINIKDVGGEDRGISIDYGVDLVDFEQEKNISDMITGILPYYVKEKDIRVDIKTEKTDEAADPTTQTHAIVKLSLEESLTLEGGWKYELTFTAENSGGMAALNGNLGIGTYSFLMDGKSKKHQFTLSDPVILASDAILFYGTPNQSGDNEGLIGTITNISLSKDPIEPIVYGSIVTRNDQGYEYEIPKYEVPKIQSVNITDYFEDPNIVPTPAQVTEKGQEYVNKEEVGIPEVSLTVSYANLGDKEVHLYDAVQVRFVKMGVTVKSKVTRYKYDVLKEHVIEIDVGKTKDSAIFTLQDAGRLKHGLIKPDRLAKESITSDKLAKGSVGAQQLDTKSLGGGGWTMPPDALPDMTGKIGTDDFKTGAWHSDPVLVSVPDNVYGGYSRNVGYLFDPSLGVPPDGLFGWTETDQQGQLTSRFHALIEAKMDQPYDMNAGSSVVKGMGYVLSPDMIFPKSIDAEKKVGDGTVVTDNIRNKAIKTNKIDDGAVTGQKVAEKAIDWRETAQNMRDKWDAIEGKVANFGKVIGPTSLPIETSGDYGAIQSVESYTLRCVALHLETAGAFIVFDYFGTGQLFSPHTLYLNNTSVGTILSTSDIYVTDTVIDYTQEFMAISRELNSLDSRVTALEQATPSNSNN